MEPGMMKSHRQRAGLEPEITTDIGAGSEEEEEEEAEELGSEQDAISAAAQDMMENVTDVADWVAAQKAENPGINIDRDYIVSNYEAA